jgi:hypothetical protein
LVDDAILHWQGTLMLVIVWLFRCLCLQQGATVIMACRNMVSADTQKLYPGGGAFNVSM